MELFRKILWWGLVVFLGIIVIGLFSFIFMSFPEISHIIIQQEPVGDFPSAKRYHETLQDTIMTIEAHFGHLKAIGVTVESSMTGEAGLPEGSAEETLPRKQDSPRTIEL